MLPLNIQPQYSKILDLLSDLDTQKYIILYTNDAPETVID